MALDLPPVIGRSATQRLYHKTGFKRTRASPCVLYHADRDLTLEVHGDDFVTAGDSEDLDWLKQVLEAKFEISTVTLGHDEHDSKSAKVLNRIITVNYN